MSGAWGCRDGVGWSLVLGCCGRSRKVCGRRLGGFLADSCGNADPGARGRCDHACPASGQHAAVVDERPPRRGSSRPPAVRVILPMRCWGWPGQRASWTRSDRHRRGRPTLCRTGFRQFHLLRPRQHLRCAGPIAAVTSGLTLPLVAKENCPVVKGCDRFDLMQLAVADRVGWPPTGSK
jgi:hypothetical protein